MNCEHELIDLNHFSFMDGVNILKQERNDFAKSRQQWIQAAFDLDRGDNTLFKKLMSEELCDSCIEKYSLIKTEI